MYSNLYLIYYKFPKAFKKILKYFKLTNLIKFILALIKYNFKNQVKIKCLFDIKFSIKNDPNYEIRLSYLPLLIEGKLKNSNRNLKTIFKDDITTVVSQIFSYIFKASRRKRKRL